VIPDHKSTGEKEKEKDEMIGKRQADDEPSEYEK
jgi:hypothetical protein